MLMSSAGFTGGAHLLSSERPNNISELFAPVKNFFHFFPGFFVGKKSKKLL